MFSGEEYTVAQLEKVLYTGKTRTSGGRDGACRSSDGRLDIVLSSPGASGSGTNPEQLFGAAWSACFISALKIEAVRMRVSLPVDLAIDAELCFGTIGGAYGLAARLKVNLPNLERAVAQALVDAVHPSCPYSKATRGNIDVSVTLV